jgi:hypothetical protein
MSAKEREDIKDHTRRYALERPGEKPKDPKFGVIVFYKAKVFSRLAELPLLAMNAGIERRPVKVKADPKTPQDERVCVCVCVFLPSHAFFCAMHISGVVVSTHAFCCWTVDAAASVGHH